MNPFEMVVLIVAIVGITGVLKARYGRQADTDMPDRTGTAEQVALAAEVRQLKDRIAVLERIVTDGDRDRGLALEREIEALRDTRRDRETGER
jgi:hypothetical protein